MLLRMQAIWEVIWKPTVEKSQTNATNVTMHPHIQALWGDIWKRTLVKSQTDAASVTLPALTQVLWGDIWWSTDQFRKEKALMLIMLMMIMMMIMLMVMMMMTIWPDGHWPLTIGQGEARFSQLAASRGTSRPALTHHFNHDHDDHHDDQFAWNLFVEIQDVSCNKNAPFRFQIIPPPKQKFDPKIRRC